MPELAEWDTFYVIVGGAAGALIGLQFVVVTLIAERPTRDAAEAGGAFNTPTIVRFSGALLLSILLRAPWHSMSPVAVLWALEGMAGAAYVAIVVRRMRARPIQGTSGVRRDRASRRAIAIPSTDLAWKMARR